MEYIKAEFVERNQLPHSKLWGIKSLFFITLSRQIAGNELPRSLLRGSSLNGPLGNCIFKPEYKKTAFLAGGVG